MADIASRDQNYKAVIQGVSSVDALSPTNIYVNPATHALLVEGSGGGGGTQYTTGDTVAAPIGTVALGWDGTLVKALPLDGSGFLKVNVAAGGGSGGTSSNFGSGFPATGTAIGATDGANMQALQVDGSGFLKVNVAAGGGAGGTSSTFGAAFPATGTAMGASDGVNMQTLLVDGSGFLKVILENSTVAVTGTFWQATQPVSAAALPLPSGASTAAKQPALGTAGSASADVLTVQGIASMTALKVDGSGVTQPVSGTFWQSTQPISGTVTANAGTNLNTSALALETGGNLATIVTNTNKIPSLGQAIAANSVPVILPSATITTLTPPSNTGYALDATLSTIDTDIKSNITLHAGTNVIGHVVADSGSTTVVTGNVASTVADGANVTLGTKADAKTTATDTTPVSIVSVLKEISFMEQTPASRAVTNGGTFAVQATLAAETTKVIGTVNVASSQTIAVTNTGTFATQSTLAAETTKVIGTVNIASSQTVGLVAGTALVGKVGIDQTTPGTTNGVSLQLDTTSGWTFSYQAALSSTKAQIKGTAGKFGGYINLFNPNTATTFIQVFNLASASVTVGSTAPDFVITLPGIATASGTGSDRNLEITMGVAMGTGITIAATTTATGSSAPANAVVGTFLYK